MPKGEGWHKELIVLSCSPPEGKAAIFSQSIVEKLHQYRNFRHRFVSGYGFQLKGEKMLELAVFGDVPVDLRECRKRDGIAIGIDGDEIRRPGLRTEKRTRLFKAGAHIIVPDLSQHETLIKLLFGTREAGALQE